MLYRATKINKPIANDQVFLGPIGIKLSFLEGAVGIEPKNYILSLADSTPLAAATRSNSRYQYPILDYSWTTILADAKKPLPRLLRERCDACSLLRKARSSATWITCGLPVNQALTRSRHSTRRAREASRRTFK